MAQLYYSSLESKMKSYLDEQKAIERMQEEQLQALRMTNQINSLAAQQQMMREQNAKAISEVIEKTVEKSVEKKIRIRSARNDIVFNKDPISYSASKQFLEKYYPDLAELDEDIDRNLGNFYSYLVETEGYPAASGSKTQAALDSRALQGEFNNYIIRRAKGSLKTSKAKSEAKPELKKSKSSK